MRAASKSSHHEQKQQRYQLYEDRVQDPYLARCKLAEPTACPECDAVFHKGSWKWIPVPDGAAMHLCPACQRIHDHVPAGVLRLSGDYFFDHKDEILKLIHHTEDREKAQHALERIMSIEKSKDGRQMVINFTGIHLTKGVGAALQHAHHGHFDITFSERDDVVQASWQR